MSPSTIFLGHESPDAAQKTETLKSTSAAPSGTMAANPLFQSSSDNTAMVSQANGHVALLNMPAGVVETSTDTDADAAAAKGDATAEAAKSSDSEPGPDDIVCEGVTLADIDNDDSFISDQPRLLPPPGESSPAEPGIGDKSGILYGGEYDFTKQTRRRRCFVLPGVTPTRYFIKDPWGDEYEAEYVDTGCFNCCAPRTGWYEEGYTKYPFLTV